MSRHYLVTGCAGFIGSAVCHRLLADGHHVIGIDKFDKLDNSHKIKEDRICELFTCESQSDGIFTLYGEREICSKAFIEIPLFENPKLDALLHFAAVPGVRKSIESPELYVRNNIQGSINVLELAGKMNIPKVLLASSSSVYGDFATMPGSNCPYPCVETDNTTKPLSPYAVSKSAMEQLGYVYHKLYGYDVLIPRYFTVYGPRGRPDMAVLTFIEKFFDGDTIEIYGDGTQKRDMTYIDDAVEATVRMLDLSGYEIINVGTGNPVALLNVLQLIKTCIDIYAGKSSSSNSLKIEYQSKQRGDVAATSANVQKAKCMLDWQAEVDIQTGIAKTVEWYKQTYNL